MTQRYWIVGGEYADCDFTRLTPGTETMIGPFVDELRARTEWQRLTFRDNLPATMRYAIAAEPVALAR